MSIREIRIFPDPILRRKCRKVRRIDDDIRKLANDMVETLVDAQGVGIAANQIGVLKRIIAIHLPEEEPYWLVNPEIIKTIGQRQIDEGCLSLPGYIGLINRSVSVTARALDQNGSKWRITAEELLSQALEHEIDHLNGIMFMDHLLEHERLREIGEENEENEENETHLHDINYNIEAHHHDHIQHKPDEQPELLLAKATLSDITPQHSISELAYELEQPKPKSTDNTNTNQ